MYYFSPTVNVNFSTIWNLSDWIFGSASIFSSIFFLNVWYIQMGNNIIIKSNILSYYKPKIIEIRLIL